MWFPGKPRDGASQGVRFGAAAALGAAAAAASLGSTIANATSGGGPGDPQATQGGNPAVYVPKSQDSADTDYFNLVNSLAKTNQGFAETQLPAYQTQVNNLLNNPYAALQMSTANNASALGLGTVSPMQLGAAQSLYGSATGALPYAAQILSTGFDPQGALYDRTLQRVMDTQNAINAQSGIAGTPYGAGVAGQTASNFNIDWQNQLLNREATAAQGYGNLLTGVGRGYAGASDLAGLGLGTMTSSGSLPYTTYQGQGTGNIAALDAMTNAQTGVQNPAIQTLNALAAYLKLGQSASGLAQSGQVNSFGQSQQLGQQLGQTLANPNLASGLDRLFAPSSMPTPYGSDLPVPMGLPGMTTTPDLASIDPFLAGGFGT